MIAIVDYDTGNLCSVWNALERIGAQYVITDDAEVIKKADKVLLPGVGEASSAMERTNCPNHKTFCSFGFAFLTWITTYFL